MYRRITSSTFTGELICIFWRNVFPISNDFIFNFCIFFIQFFCGFFFSLFTFQRLATEADVCFSSLIFYLPTEFKWKDALSKYAFKYIWKRLNFDCKNNTFYILSGLQWDGSLHFKVALNEKMLREKSNIPNVHENQSSHSEKNVNIFPICILSISSIFSQ